MPKEAPEVPLVAIKLDDSSSVPLYKQLSDAIRGSILSGRFRSGLKLPGTRILAEELRISRNTVLLAFDQLMVEGYLKGKVGAGTYVTDDIPDRFTGTRKMPVWIGSGPANPESDGKATQLSLSKRFVPENNIVPFQHGTPSVQDFPFDKWLKLFNGIMRRSPLRQLSEMDATGYKVLREAIARYLQVYRAVNCTPEQIFIVNGSQQGLYLIGKVLMREGCNVLLEDPFYFGARDALRSAKVNIHPVPVDDEGVRIDHIVKHYPEAEAIYTTPSHQYPLGSTMSVSRRLKLLELAAGRNMWIIEDDYDGEFRYAGNPLPSLQGMDKNRRVIYIGTFSKVLFPGLRLGYLVLPTLDLVDSFSAAKSVIDRQSPVLDQLVTAEFMERGYFTSHIRKMRILYKERQDFLIKEVRKELGDLINVSPAASGMHVLAWLPDHMDDREVSKALKENMLVARPLSNSVLKYKRKPALILGYTSFNERQIKWGVNILKETIGSFCK